MRKCLLAVLFAVVTRPGYGQDAAPSTPLAASAAGYGCAAAPQNDQALPKAPLAKADHLRIAAEHLEAAGLADEAQRVRKKAAEEQAHATTAPVAQIIVSFRMFEFSPKLGTLSSQRYGGSKEMSVLELLSKLQQSLSPGNPSRQASSGPTLLSLIEALRRDRLICVQAEPDLIVVPDRPAHLNVGGELGYRTKDAEGKEVTKFMEYGTQVDLTAHIVPNERIQLDFRFCVSEPDPAHNSDGIPAVRGREVAARVEARSGETIAISGLVAKEIRSSSDRAVHHTADDVQTLVLVTPEIVTKENAVAIKAKSAVRR
jgi:Flp pilus assembly secretin CpaC